MEKLNDKEALMCVGGSKIGSIIGVIIGAVGAFFVGIYNGWLSTTKTTCTK